MHPRPASNRMKQLSSLRFLVSLVGVLCLIGCPGKVEPRRQGKAPPPEIPSGPLPAASVDDPNYDFGVMEAGEELEHTFEITNTGEGVLTLLPGQASCKCTSFTVDKKELKKGEVALATVKWRPLEVQESFRQVAPITSNDPELPQIHLNIRGIVKSIFTVKPGLTWELGEFQEGEEKEYPGYVFCNVDDKFSVEDLKTSSPALTASLEPVPDVELKKENAKAGYLIKLKAGKGLPVGQFQETVTFKCKSSKEAEIRIDLRGYRPGPLSIIGKGFAPKTMVWDIGTFDARQGFKQNLSLFYSGEEGSELKIESIESEPPGILVNLKKDENFKGNGKRQRYVAEVEIPPGDKAQIHNEGKTAVVKLKTNSAEIGTIVMRLKYNALLK